MSQTLLVTVTVPHDVPIDPRRMLVQIRTALGLCPVTRGCDVLDVSVVQTAGEAMEKQMSESELRDRGFAFERYGRGTDGGAGCIIAFYGSDSDYWYAGQSMQRRRQPLIDDPFPSKADAVAAAAAMCAKEPAATEAAAG